MKLVTYTWARYARSCMDFMAKSSTVRRAWCSRAGMEANGCRCAMNGSQPGSPLTSQQIGARLRLCGTTWVVINTQKLAVVRQKNLLSNYFERINLRWSRPDVLARDTRDVTDLGAGHGASVDLSGPSYLCAKQQQQTLTTPSDREW
jgi:hypothetical protein